LSKINLINYKSINNSILSKNIYSQYKLDLPFSNSFEKPEERLSLVEDIYVVCSKDDSLNLHPFIIAENKKIPLDSLRYQIMDWQSERDSLEIPLMVYRLYIHRGINKNFITGLKAELSGLGISRISYAVIPQDASFDYQYYHNYVFASEIHLQ
jgi:hypothetical protein